MKILHIYSNWKWTGPAEHALNLALTLKEYGHDVSFACALPPEGVTESIEAFAGQAGIQPVTQFKLKKHFSILDNLKDIPALRRFIKAGKFDLVHSHLPNDHFITGMALRTSFSKTAIVRTCYDGDGVNGGFKTRLLFSLMTDGLLTVSERTKSRIMRRRYLPSGKIWKIHVPVDLGKFDKGRVKSNRARYNLSEEAVVGGIVARVQKHRRFEVLLKALQIVIDEFPGLKFMIIGRGSNIEEIAIKPSQKMGIRTNLIFTGYKGEDYTGTLACLNFKIFLMPGTDGSCRAVREAMAMGIPVIAANRGMLPEIIEHEKDGLIIDDTPENLASAIMHLVEHPEKRKEMGDNAFQKSCNQFNLELQTKKIEAIYEKVLSRKTEKKR